MKTSELTGVALDWAVAKCEGDMGKLAACAVCEGKGQVTWYGYAVIGERTCRTCNGSGAVKCASLTPTQYSTDWSQGGPIIEREVISLIKTSKSGFWSAYFVRNTTVDYEKRQADADTPLVAAMRCYVASKLGDEVEIPAELQETT